MENIAIITARGGSKRIPRKNIKPFLGFPIIKYSIDAAINSGCFDEIMVSTDDNEIAEVSKKLGAKVPFLRSAATADDYSSSDDAVKEVLLEYKKRGVEFEYCCCIYPTAPFISSHKLIDSLKRLKKSNADSLVPVVRFSHPTQRALLVKEGRVQALSPGEFEKRSQDLIPTYHDAGQFYWMKIKPFLKEGVMLQNCVAFELSEAEAQDIDNESDWELAELKYRFQKERKRPSSL
jgi:pseudaminic acid cytidylyltransferase